MTPTKYRLALLILSCLMASKMILAQSADTAINRLYNEIANSYDVQSKYIGCYGNLSTQYKKVDSLKSLTGPQRFLEYFNSNSVNLKYYAYVEILALDDELALEKLLGIINCGDSINIEFAGQVRDNIKLSELLTRQYLSHIKMKYYYGGISTYDGRTYAFEKKNRPKWRAKTAIIKEIIQMNGLNEKWVEADLVRD